LSFAGAIGGGISHTVGFALLHHPILNGVGGFMVFTLVFATMGIIIGAALGLALQDKRKILYLSCGCSMGFVIGRVIVFVILNAIGFSVVDATIGLALADSIGFSIMSAIAGATSGLALAYIIKKEEDEKTIMSSPKSESISKSDNSKDLN